MSYQPSWINQTLIGFGLASLFSDLSYEMTTIALPALLQEIINEKRVPLILGIISGVSEGIASIVRLISGAMSDRMRYKIPFIATGYALSGISLGFIGFATKIGHIFAARVLAWSGKGLREAPRDALIAESVETPYYGRAFGFHRSLDTVGAILGPLIMFFIMGSVSLRSIFFITWIPGIISVIVICALAHESKSSMPRFEPHASFNEQLRALPIEFLVFLGIYVVFASAFFNKMLIILYAQQTLTSSASSMSWAVQQTALLYVAFNIVRAAGEFSIGYIVDYAGRRPILALFGYGFFGVASLLLALHVSSIGLLVGIFLLAGISAASVKVASKAYAAELLPLTVRGLGFALLQLIEGGGDVIASFMVGLIWTNISSNSAFTYASFLSLIAMCLLLVSPNCIKPQLSDRYE